MRVSEVFYSIQGEGASVGQPAMFLRLAGCNLKCTWCDTKYALGSGREITQEELSLLTESNADLLVITGGEPLLQQDELIKTEIGNPFEFIEIETNGTIVPTPEFLDAFGDRLHFNVSPKLSNSGNPINPFETSFQLSQVLATIGPYSYLLKFVVGNRDDLKEVKFILELLTTRYALTIEPSQVYLMPEGITREVQITKSPEIVEMCKENGYIFSPRLHILLWDSKRGV